MSFGCYDPRNICDQTRFSVAPIQLAKVQVDLLVWIAYLNHVVCVDRARLRPHFVCGRNRLGPVELYAFHSRAGDQPPVVLHHLNGN